MRPNWHVCAGVAIAAGLLGQDPPQAEGVRGSLLEWEGSATSGELSIRTRTHHVYRFRFDDKTRFETADKDVSIQDLRVRDVVQVFSDRGAGVPHSYAQRVQVLRRGPTPPKPARHVRRRSYSPPVEERFPRGNLTLSGVVVSRSEDRLVLRTRLEGEKTILLRSDTRYLDGGQEVDASALEVNTRVFMRVGKNLNREIEAYRVVWGEILRPPR